MRDLNSHCGVSEAFDRLRCCLTYIYMQTDTDVSEQHTGSSFKGQTVTVQKEFPSWSATTNLAALTPQKSKGLNCTTRLFADTGDGSCLAIGSSSIPVKATSVRIGRILEMLG